VWHLENQLDDSVALPVRAVLLARDWLRRRVGRPVATRAGTYLLLRELATRRLVDKILVFTRHKADFLRRSGLPGIEYVPLGHHPVWGVAEGGASRERDVDVLFLGMLNGRRRVIVENIRDALAVRGIALKTNYDYDPTGSAWGEARNALIARAKIYLCVYRYPLDYSGMRFSLGMGNGALIVSEPVADPHPFKAGVHFVEAGLPSLSDIIFNYLQDEAARLRIVSAASACLTQEYSMTRSARQIIEITSAVDKANASPAADTKPRQRCTLSS